MREQFERYIANLEESARLVKLRVPHGLTDQEILDQVQNAAKEMRQLCIENNALLDALVFSRTPESLSPEDVQDLNYAVSRLFQNAKSIDVGISYRIHRLLYDYARLHQDRDMLIQELYYLGMTSFYLNLKISPMGINVLKDAISDYFSLGAAYFSQWEEISSKETRGYIIRCMANRNLTIPRDLNEDGHYDGRTPEEIYGEYMRNFRQTMDVVQSPYYRSQNPDIPWDSFVYSMHYDRITFLSFLRKAPIPEIQRDVMESAEYVYRYQESVAAAKNSNIINARTIYFYAAARYHYGILSASELMDILLSVYRTRNESDFSITGIQLNIMYPQYLTGYAEVLPEEEKPRYQEQVRQALQNFYHYLLDMPRNEYINKVAASLRDVMRSLPAQETYLATHLLDTIVTCHAPTYIHSVMVAWLNRRITEELIRQNPQALEGVFGYCGVPSILEHREDICHLAYICGLYHDLGKSMVINYIGIYGRRLLDEEFTCIQYHSQLGYSILQNFPGYEDMSQVALHHHRSYDGKGGYPKGVPPCPERVRAIAYITSVSDSADAATDNVGRSYVSAKSYGTLVEELFQRSGKSYAPEIVRLFEDRNFRDALGRDMAQYRKSVYCKVYREIAE